MGYRPSLSGFVPQQAFFDFLSPEEVNHLTRLNHHRIQQAAQARDKRHQRSLTPRPISDADLFDQIPQDLLERPLIKIHDNADSMPAFFREIQEDHGDVLAQAAEDDNGESVDGEWSDTAVAQLHEGLLLSSMAALAAKSNVTEKVETLKWFYLPDIYGWRKKTGPNRTSVYKPVYANQIPFTFQRCCAYMGYDPQRLRDGLSSTLRAAGLGQYLPE